MMLFGLRQVQSKMTPPNVRKYTWSIIKHSSCCKQIIWWWTFVCVHNLGLRSNIVTQINISSIMTIIIRLTPCLRSHHAPDALLHTILIWRVLFSIDLQTKLVRLACSFGLVFTTRTVKANSSGKMVPWYVCCCFKFQCIKPPSSLTHTKEWLKHNVKFPIPALTAGTNLDDYFVLPVYVGMGELTFLVSGRGLACEQQKTSNLIGF